MMDIYNNLKYNDNECSIFPYLRSYHNLLDSWLKSNKFTKNIIKRYILISFWLEYRGANHRGDNFTINKISENEYLNNKIKIHKLSCELFKKNPDIIKNFDPNAKIELDDNFFDLKKRRDAFFTYFDKPINSTKDYINLVGYMSEVKIDLGEYLYIFVTTGKKTSVPNKL